MTFPEWLILLSCGQFLLLTFAYIWIRMMHEESNLLRTLYDHMASTARAQASTIKAQAATIVDLQQLVGDISQRKAAPLKLVDRHRSTWAEAINRQVH